MCADRCRICIGTSMHIFVYVYLYVYGYVNVYVDVHMCICMHMHMCMCTCACIIYICACIRTWVHRCVYTYIYMRTHTHLLSYSCMQYMCNCTYIYVYYGTCMCGSSPSVLGLGLQGGGFDVFFLLLQNLPASQQTPNPTPTRSTTEALSPKSQYSADRTKLRALRCRTIRTRRNNHTIIELL